MHTEHIRGAFGAYFLSSMLPDDLLPVTPTVLAAATHDWNIPQLAKYDLVLMDASTPVDLSGIVWPSDRRVRFLVHVGTNPTNTITLLHQDSGSAAANRFILPNNASVAVPIGGSVGLWYDNTVSRLRVLVAS